MNRASYFPLNIALVILHADPARGGAERYTVDLAAALSARGCATSLLASSFAPDSAPASYERVLIPAKGATRPRRYERFLDALDESLARGKYDLVHAMLPVRRCDVYHPHAGIAAESMATGHLKHSSPLARGLARAARPLHVRRRKFAAIERRLLTGPTPPIVLSLSNYVAGAVARHYDLPAERRATLFNAVDTARFDPAVHPAAGAELRRRLGIEPDEIVALIIAQDYERKGLREAAAATARLRAAGAKLRLLVVGRHDPRPYLADLAGAGGAIYAGHAADPYPFYRSADFFVLPTRHDPCSLVVLEALAMGLPVVSTRFNGACEIMTDAVHGFVLPHPADVPALTAAMQQLIDCARRQTMASACLALRPRLAYPRHLDDLLAIYRRARRAS